MCNSIKISRNINSNYEVIASWSIFFPFHQGKRSVWVCARVCVFYLVVQADTAIKSTISKCIFPVDLSNQSLTYSHYLIMWKRQLRDGILAMETNHFVLIEFEISEYALVVALNLDQWHFVSLILALFYQWRSWCHRHLTWCCVTFDMAIQKYKLFPWHTCVSNIWASSGSGVCVRC